MSQIFEQCFGEDQTHKKHQKRKQQKFQEKQIFANQENSQAKKQEEIQQQQQDDLQLDNIEEILKHANKRTGLGFEENQKYKKITGGFRKAISKTKYIQEKEKKQTNKTEIIDNDNEELKFDSKNESIRQRKEPESLFKTKQKKIKKNN